MSEKVSEALVAHPVGFAIDSVMLANMLQGHLGVGVNPSTVTNLILKAMVPLPEKTRVKSDE